jgi:methylated-DNA-[protein]-cysteine S-methyltransferase
MLETSTLQDQGYLKQIIDYFDRGRTRFSMPVDLQGFSPFERRVWKAAQQVPFGHTRSYGWIAKRLGSPRAYRAVGNALGKNPVPIVIPCHRIVRSNGALGGFGAGIAWKKRLLVHEGIVL